MEHEAHKRDQTLLACAAQEPKLLPKQTSNRPKKEASEKINRMVSPMFEAYYKEHGRPEDKK